MFNIANYPDRYVKASGDKTGFEDAHNLAAKFHKGGTIILEDDAQYFIDRQVVINPAHVHFHGGGSLVNVLHNGVAFLIDATGATNYKRDKSRSLGFVTVRLNGHKDSVGVHFDTAPSGDRSSSPLLQCFSIENAGVAAKLGRNAYLITFRDCNFGWNQLGIQRLKFDNNGEQIYFDGGSIYNGGRAFWFADRNGDMRFNNTSFDYNQQIGYTDTQIEFFGCHFESKSAVTTRKWQFEVDNGGNMTFHGGGLGLVDWNNGQLNAAQPPAEQLFTVWGQGGSFNSYGLKGVTPNHWTKSVCNKMENYKAI